MRPPVNHNHNGRGHGISAAQGARIIKLLEDVARLAKAANAKSDRQIKLLERIAAQGDRAEI